MFEQAAPEFANDAQDEFEVLVVQLAMEVPAELGLEMLLDLA